MWKDLTRESTYWYIRVSTLSKRYLLLGSKIAVLRLVEECCDSLAGHLILLPGHVVT